ncbi:23575_t:CDS:2, partial [Racocetra persica]
KECEEYVKGCPGALYKSFYTRIEAQDFIDQQNIEVKDKLNVWTDGFCKRNRLSDAVGGSKNPAIELTLPEQSVIDKKSKKKQSANFTWFRENEKTNFQRPIMFPDDEGHITEYIQIKL